MPQDCPIGGKGGLLGRQFMCSYHPGEGGVPGCSLCKMVWNGGGRLTLRVAVKLALVALAVGESSVGQVKGTDKGLHFTSKGPVAHWRIFPQFFEMRTGMSLGHARMPQMAGEGSVVVACPLAGPFHHQQTVTQEPTGHVSVTPPHRLSARCNQLSTDPFPQEGWGTWGCRSSDLSGPLRCIRGRLEEGFTG